MTRLMYTMLVLLWTGCGADYGVEIKEGGLTAGVGTDTVDDNGDKEEEEEEEGLSEEEIAAFEGSMIHIVHPASGDFLAFGQDNDFEAVIETPDGEILEFEGIDWTSDVDAAWTPVGGHFEDDSIDVGAHNISAVAILPDGSRVAHTVGGVLVQHEDAGTYVGDMIISVDMEVGGTPIGTSCIGSALLVVDAYGELAQGGSSCTIDLLGYMTFEIDHNFEYDLESPTLDGNAFVKIPILDFELPFSSIGGIFNGEVQTTWEGGLGSFADIEGTLEASRITRDITAL